MTVVELGPAVVRCGERIENCREVIESLDDDLVLIDDRAVPVGDVWSDMLQSAIGDAVQPVVVVHPTGWSGRRIDTVRTAARRWCPEVVTRSRSEVLRVTAATVVEIGDDLVIVAADEVSAVPRSGETVVETVVRQVGGRGPVLIDAPDGVAHALPLARSIVDALRHDGVEATVTGPHALRRSVRDGFAAAGADELVVKRRRAIRSKPMAVTAGAVLTIVTVGAVTVFGDPRPPVQSMAMLVEGRVGVLVPVSWTVRRITVGPGSRRLQAVSPAGGSVALHVTQSPLPQHQSVEQIAAALRTALAAESTDVFTDFRPDDRRAGRQVSSYRERRGTDEIDWFVFADGVVRIGVGCQSPLDKTDLVSDACDAAVRSAHAVF